jgi:hypothetical protein
MTEMSALSDKNVPLMMQKILNSFIGCRKPQKLVIFVVCCLSLL